MAEYIERKKLEEAFDNADPDVCESYPDGHSDWGFGRENVRDVIRGVPAADVAPVVRCKDCEHSWEDIGGLTCSYGCCVDCIVREDFFCADGAKREEAKRNEKGD